MVKVITFNGWASSPHAWDLCPEHDRLYTYLESLDKVPDREIAAEAGPLILIGWSMGGSVALQMASKFPEKVAGLVLVAASVRMMEEKETGWMGMSIRRLEAFKKGVEMTHGEGFFGFPEGKPNPYQADTSENLDRGLKYLEETDIREEVRDLAAKLNKRNIPVFIFHSEKDGVVRPQSACFLRGVFPNAKVEMIEGSEHALPIMIPEKITAAVKEIKKRYEA